MPQEFQVLRCVSCETFQVHIVKMKNIKWECTLCRLKQSITHIYAKSFAARDCRIQVQMLNGERGKHEASDSVECDNNTRNFAQQLEKLSEVGGSKSCGKHELEQQQTTEDCYYSPDIMTSSPLVTTSRTSYHNNSSIACDNGLKSFEPTKEEKQRIKTGSRWSKYLISNKEFEDM